MATLLSYLSAAVALAAALMHLDGKVDNVPDIRKIHPAVFELVTCWESDTEQPVVTEINLEAVRKNRNQFDPGRIRINRDWIECKGDDGDGFRRFRVLSSNNGQYRVEFQKNAGGTLTTTVLIEFLIENRGIRRACKASPATVLRVMSVETM